MTAPFRTERRVEFRDTDAAGIVHFTAFFHWMESAEHALWRELGVELVGRDEDGIVVSWPRVSATCDYAGAVRFGDMIEIQVQVEKIGRTSVTFAFTFTHAGTVVARGGLVAVRCRLPAGSAPSPVPIPADVAARLAAYAD